VWLWVGHLGPMVLRGLTFEMGGGTRLAGARPLDGRVERLVVAHAGCLQEVLPIDGISTTRNVAVATAQSCCPTDASVSTSTVTTQMVPPT